MEQPGPPCKGEKGASLPAGGGGPRQGGEGLQPPGNQDGWGVHEGPGDAGQGGHCRGQDQGGAAAEDRHEGQVQDDAPCLHQPATGWPCQNWKARVKKFPKVKDDLGGEILSFKCGCEFIVSKLYLELVKHE